MEVLLKPFRFLYKVYFLFCFSLLLVLIFPFFKYYLAKKERYPTAFKWMRFYARMTLILSGIKLKVKGREHILKGQPYLICANHSSFVDIPCLYTIFKDYYTFTGKQEIEKWPLFHIFYTSGMNILVDRHNARKAVLAFKRMGEVLDEGSPLFIFPEGTISETAPKMGEFKGGIVSLAIKKQIPILPITFTTNWKRLQRSGFWEGKAGPGFAEAIIHPIIETKGLKKEDMSSLQNILRNTINKPLKELYGVE